MEELDQMRRSAHEALIDLRMRQHASHGDDPVGDGLGEGRQIGLNVEVLRGKRRPQATESGDDLVEDQQDTVPRADLAQTLQVAAWRHDHTGRALHRLDDHRRDRRGIVQRYQPLQFIGQMQSPLRLAAAEAHIRRRIGVRQMIDPGIIKGANIFRLETMPPTEMPPSPTP
jgi:hypothetical protein